MSADPTSVPASANRIAQFGLHVLNGASMNQRVFPIPTAMQANSHIDGRTYEHLYRRSVDDPEAFWKEQARILMWSTPFKRVKNTRFSPEEVSIEWFGGGKLNASFNCLDRHALRQGDLAAILWEGDMPGERSRVSWNDLLLEVSRLANVLADLGVRKGDFVSIYLPVVPEAVAAMLACARIGAVHFRLFGRGSRRTNLGLPVAGAHHRRRGIARRPTCAVETECR